MACSAARSASCRAGRTVNPSSRGSARRKAVSIAGWRRLRREAGRHGGTEVRAQHAPAGASVTKAFGAGPYAFQ